MLYMDILFALSMSYKIPRITVDGIIIKDKKIVLVLSGGNIDVNSMKNSKMQYLEKC